MSEDLVLYDTPGFTIADLSVLPRVAMYPLVQVPPDAARHPHVARWLDAVGRRPSIVRSEDVRPRLPR
jgi:glutathione S-transferase